MNANKKSSRMKASGKKQKTERKKELKEKTVAAEMGATEMGATVLREEAAKPVPPAAHITASETQASKQSPPEKLPVAVTASKVKTSAKAPEPRPAPPSASEVEASRPALKPHPAPRPQTVAKPLPEPGPERQAKTADSAAATIEHTFKAAALGTVAVNRKLLDFARDNVNCSLDHAKDLAAARNPARVLRLQMDFWHDCLANFASQAEELRALSLKLVANANEPIREHMRRSLKAKAA